MSGTPDKRRLDAGAEHIDLHMAEGMLHDRTPSAPQLTPYAPNHLLRGPITPPEWTAVNAALQVSHDGNAITIEPRKWPRLLHVAMLMVSYASFAVFFAFSPQLMDALRTHGWVQRGSVTNGSFWTTVVYVWTGIVALAVLGVIIWSQRKSHAKGAILRVDRVSAVAEFPRISWSVSVASVIALQFVRQRAAIWSFPLARRSEAHTPRCQLAIVYTASDGSIRRRLVYEDPSLFVQFKPLLKDMQGQLPFPIEIHVLKRSSCSDAAACGESADSTSIEETVEVERRSIPKTHQGLAGDV